jgi:uncharacterized membrane protein
VFAIAITLLVLDLAVPESRSMIGGEGSGISGGRIWGMQRAS